MRWMMDRLMMSRTMMLMIHVVRRMVIPVMMLRRPRRMRWLAE